MRHPRYFWISYLVYGRSIHAVGEAARIYHQAFSRDPEFYSMFRTLASYKKTMNDQTVVVLPSDSPYAHMLMGYTD
jgi:modulator of FtsH protease HflC